MDIQQIINEFKEYLLSKKRTIATITAYTQDISQLLKYLNHPSFDQINTKTLNKFIKYTIDDLGYTKKTVSRKLNSISTFFNFLMQKGYLKSNIAKDLKYPQLDNNPPRFLTPIEYKAIRDTARKNNRVYTMIELLLQTGIKISEISNLKIDDVILTQPAFLNIKNSNTDNRIVELNKTIQEDLKKYIQNRKSVPNDKKYLFITRTGKQVQVRNIRTAIDRVFHKSGLKDAHVNDLRNTFIIYQLENGLDVDKIAEIVGHRRKATTQKYIKCTNRKKTGKKHRIVPL